MSSFGIQGLVAPVFTPFHNDGSLNLSVIPAYLQFLVDHDIRSIVVGGTSGESVCLSLKERMDVLTAWVEEARPAAIKIVAQVGGVPLPEVIDMAKFANSIGVDAIMTLPEIYYKPKTTEDVVSYLETISEAAPGLPLIYYHFPMMSGVELNIPEFFRLASSRIPNFKAMKADLDVAVKVVTLMEEDQRIYIGNHLIAPAVLMGHDSSIATVTNIFPNLMQDIQLATQSGDVEKARKYQELMNRIVTEITSEGDFLPAMKVAMHLITGIEVGPPRRPLNFINHQGEVQIAGKLKSLGITLKNETVE